MSVDLRCPVISNLTDIWNKFAQQRTFEITKVFLHESAKFCRCREVVWWVEEDEKR